MCCRWAQRFNCDAKWEKDLPKKTCNRCMTNHCPMSLNHFPCWKCTLMLVVLGTKGLLCNKAICKCCLCFCPGESMSSFQMIDLNLELQSIGQELNLGPAELGHVSRSAASPTPLIKPHGHKSKPGWHFAKQDFDLCPLVHHMLDSTNPFSHQKNHASYDILTNILLWTGNASTSFLSGINLIHLSRAGGLVDNYLRAQLIKLCFQCKVWEETWLKVDSNVGGVITFKYRVT